MCFAPQRRALFRHRNFQKWSDNGVLCTFWLGNVLRATMACNFSSFIWPAGSAPAALASLLFDPPEPQIIGKTQCFATFLPFRASASAFFWLFLFSDLLSSTLLLSDSSHLCFSICPYCRSEVWLLNFLRSELTYKPQSFSVCLVNPWCFWHSQDLWLRSRRFTPRPGASAGAKEHALAERAGPNRRCPPKLGINDDCCGKRVIKSAINISTWYQMISMRFVFVMFNFWISMR